VPKIERSILEQYVRRIVLVDLCEESVERCLKRLRRLDWADKTSVDLVVQYLSQPWLISYANVQWLASLVAGITFYHDSVGHRIVDNILEEHRLGLEVIFHPNRALENYCPK